MLREFILASMVQQKDSIRHKQQKIQNAGTWSEHHLDRGCEDQSAIFIFRV